MKYSRYGSEVGYHSHFKTFKTFDAKTLSLVTDLVELFFNENHSHTGLQQLQQHVWFEMRDAPFLSDQLCHKKLCGVMWLQLDGAY